MPFTTEQFLGVFVGYNQAIWPMQILAYVAGLGAVFLTIRPTAWAHRAITGILAFFWVFVGVFYQVLFHLPVNVVTGTFGTLFVVEGIVLLVAGWRGQLRFVFRRDTVTTIGAGFIVYAVLVYPVIGVLAGHAYPEAPMFGVAPCPLTIFTLGLLFWSEERPTRWLFAIPIGWSLLGVSTALQFGIWEDIGLTIAGILTVVWLFLPHGLEIRLHRPTSHPV